MRKAECPYCKVSVPKPRPDPKNVWLLHIMRCAEGKGIYNQGWTKEEWDILRADQTNDDNAVKIFLIVVAAIAAVVVMVCSIANSEAWQWENQGQYEINKENQYDGY